ncbi:hypothetical protein OG948_34810 (plasmid) [Embleya sp. NBC_00888]|uniref:hypothetical protein n=1 Tax=Embleya sp. NBC_00888 TaxID=2975960 RepID=UPI003863C1C5|nr:hypothetical protein OG948_34810 [Embleya sp. NBC_00888]
MTLHAAARHEQGLALSGLEEELLAVLRAFVSDEEVVSSGSNRRRLYRTSADGPSVASSASVPGAWWTSGPAVIGDSGRAADRVPAPSPSPNPGEWGSGSAVERHEGTEGRAERAEPVVCETIPRSTGRPRSARAPPAGRAW